MFLDFCNDFDSNTWITDGEMEARSFDPAVQPTTLGLCYKEREIISAFLPGTRPKGEQGAHGAITPSSGSGLGTRKGGSLMGHMVVSLQQNHPWIFWLTPDILVAAKVEEKMEHVLGTHARHL